MISTGASRIVVFQVLMFGVWRGDPGVCDHSWCEDRESEAGGHLVTVTSIPSYLPAN